MIEFLASLDKMCFDLYQDGGGTGNMIVRDTLIQCDEFLLFFMTCISVFQVADIKQLIWDVYGEQYSKHVIARRAFFSLDTVNPKADLAVVSAEVI